MAQVKFASINSIKRHTGLLNYNEDADRTRYYLENLSEFYDYMTSISHIDFRTYQDIIKFMPGDLSTRLRLVPDSHLVPRLCHLYSMIDHLINRIPIGQVYDYDLVSIEGSNRNFPFDMDLILYDNQYKRLYLVDFTSSGDPAIMLKKQGIIESYIRANKLPEAYAWVQQFVPRMITLKIDTPFTSSEPGTQALKFLDMVSSWPEQQREIYFSKCVEVYHTVNANIAMRDFKDPEGLYKSSDYDLDDINKSIDLVSKQSDVDSFEFLCNLSDKYSDFKPFKDGLVELAKNANKLKFSSLIEGAKVNYNKNLSDRLDSMEQNWMCKCLRFAMMTDKVVAITDSNTIQLLENFPVHRKETYLPAYSKYKMVCKHENGHVFTIKFHPDHMDENLRRSLIHDTVRKDDKFKSKDDLDDDVTVAKLLRDSLNMRKAEYNNLMSLSTARVKDSIWSKVSSISALASNDLENMGRSTSSMLDSLVKYLEATYLGTVMSHQYEIYKSIAASLKTSPGDSTYYVGINGSYDSISLIKMSSTLDSFTRCSFCVIYKPERSLSKRCSRFKYKMEDEICTTSFYTCDSNQLSYNLRLPMILISLATWEIENNIDNGAIEQSKIQQIVFDSFCHIMINRDPFAQASEQVRYFYMSSIGYGGQPQSIVDKTTFLNVKYPWEFLYLLRSYKLAACLIVINQSSNLGFIMDKDSKELKVCFPHSSYYSRSFSQTVSSMYLCNIYNKFRAFHEVSEAICYNEIVEERSIYNQRKSESIYEVSGMSPTLYKLCQEGHLPTATYIYSNEFISEESAFCIKLSDYSGRRYCGSITYIIGATIMNSVTSNEVITSIYRALGKSPIEACSMRGSMEPGPSTSKKQGLRAASNILEELIRDYEMDPKDVNKSVLGSLFLFDKISESYYAFSIFNKALIIYLYETDKFRYRIVQKDQKGHREISVLNATFRLGALFVETIAKELSSVVGDVDVVNNPDKDMIVEQEVKRSFKLDATKPGVYCYDNSDQKRWGPNHNMNFFAATLFVLLKNDMGLYKMASRVFDKVFDKRAKFPESLIDLVEVKGISTSNSIPIHTFIRNHLQDMNNKIYEGIMPMGMCQGIFHAMSSIHHAIMCKSIESLVRIKYPKVMIRSFSTSDDGLRIIFIPSGLDRFEVIKFIHNVINSVGSLFNIIRSNPKSTFSFHIAELNSNFYKNSKLATPSLKQRIAKIDVGFGVNPIEDYLEVLSSAANYLANGGSYTGSYILSVLNIVLHTEQWLRWDLVSSEHYYKPVELGGFPVIEPVSTIISGGISNIYLRSCKYLSSEMYSLIYVNSALAPPEQVHLSDFSRSSKQVTKKSAVMEDLTIYKSAGPLGLFQLVRTDKKLSQFERRHGISKWPIPESFATLDKSSPFASNFIFTIFRQTGMSIMETNVGVNSFFIRFAEPWVSHFRTCYKVSDSSPYRELFGLDKTFISHKDVIDLAKSMSITESIMSIRRLADKCPQREDINVMLSQLRVRLDDSLEVFNFLRSQEAEVFCKSKGDPTIRKVELKGHTAMQTGTYFCSILKALSGEKAKNLINESERNLRAYDELSIKPTELNIPILDAIIQADNTTALFNKFIRRNTKMILPTPASDVRELVLAVFKNKFTENMGLVLSGSLNIVGDREGSYSHANWAQELIDRSKDFESNIAQAVLAGKSVNVVRTGIRSDRPIISDHESFKVDVTSRGAKSVIIDAMNKDAFVTKLKMWISAQVGIMLTNRTIEGFMQGKLTYGHDYYIGDKRFFRYTKGQYFKVLCNGIRGTHAIQTVTKRVQSRLITSYRHYFLFPINVNGMKVDVEINDKYKSEKWVQQVANDLRSISAIKTSEWRQLEPISGFENFHIQGRRTYYEQDYLMIASITPGMEFDITTNEDSLCLFLTNPQLRINLPVTYLTPKNIDSINLGYTLTHPDIKVAIDNFFSLKEITKDFEQSKIRRNKELLEFLDFLLVGSSVATPDVKVTKMAQKIGLTVKTAIQLDILRCALLTNSGIGVHYTSSRFNQFLLNLGNRRHYNHTYLSRRITGARVEYESEVDEEEDDFEPIIDQGEIQSRNVTQEPLIESSEVQAESESDSMFRGLRDMPVTNWADEVIDFYSQNTENIEVAESPQTASLDDELFESDQESEASTVKPEFILSSGNRQNIIEMGESIQESMQASLIGEFDVSSISTAGSNITAAADNDLLGGAFADLEDIMGEEFDFDFDESSSDILKDHREAAEASINNLDELNELFAGNITKEYKNVIDQKDQTIASVVTGFTINPALENSRSITNYLVEWLKGPGSVRIQSMKSMNFTNIAQITRAYIAIKELIGTTDTNVLQTAYGDSEVRLPIELTALVLINEIYL
uniref:RNA-directed RNA polymerase L n=1 Tax=Rhizoctonia solani negative-stranded virus 4 TaxID=1708386 RepID=A0A0M4L089_9VIRU|nr:RNA-dependent RNA polymerase [Rhizoctonia solani negative-stranded virus 4]